MRVLGGLGERVQWHSFWGIDGYKTVLLIFGFKGTCFEDQYVIAQWEFNLVSFTSAHTFDTLKIYWERLVL